MLLNKLLMRNYMIWRMTPLNTTTLALVDSYQKVKEKT